MKNKKDSMIKKDIIVEQMKSNGNFSYPICVFSFAQTVLMFFNMTLTIINLVILLKG